MPDAVVLRLRVDACQLHVDHPRVIIAHTASGTPGKETRQAALALAPHLDPKLATRLRYATATRRPLIDAIARHDVNSQFKEKYEKTYLKCVAVVGEKYAARLMKVHGLSRFIETDTLEMVLTNFKSETGADWKRLMVKMTDCIASRIDDVRYIQAVRDFVREFEVPKAKLHTLMCDGLAAAKMAELVFVQAVRDFVREFEVPKAKLHTLMSGGLAAKMAEPVFVQAVRDFVREFEVPKAKLHTLMCDGLAAKIAEPAFVQAVHTLTHAFKMSGDDLVRFLKNSCVTRHTNDKFFLELKVCYNKCANQSTFLGLGRGKISSRLMNDSFLSQRLPCLNVLSNVQIEQMAEQDKVC